MNIFKYGLCSFILFLGLGCGQSSRTRTVSPPLNPQGVTVPQVRPVGTGTLESEGSALVGRLQFQAFLPGAVATNCTVPPNVSGICPDRNQNLLYYRGSVQLKGTISFKQTISYTCPNFQKCLPESIDLPFECDAQFQGGGFVCQSFRILGQALGNSYKARGELLPSENLTHNYRIIFFAICGGPGVPETC